jgi:predicted RNA-binding Zn-ribbon protein involved in translation (DUF1610 family)
MKNRRYCFTCGVEMDLVEEWTVSAYNVTTGRPIEKQAQFKCPQCGREDKAFYRRARAGDGCIRRGGLA